jgi:hypothetical protein
MRLYFSDAIYKIIFDWPLKLIEKIRLCFCKKLKLQTASNGLKRDRQAEYVKIVFSETIAWFSTAYFAYCHQIFPIFARSKIIIQYGIG